MGTTDSSGALRSATVTAVFHAGSPGQGTVGSLRLIVADLNQQLLGADPVVRLRSSALETATTSSNVGNFFLPGIVAFNLIQSGLLFATGVFAGYKSSGVLRRVKATGVDSASFVLAHATASLTLGIIQTTIMLVVGSLLFALTLNLGLLLSITILGYLVFLALGFAISGLVRDPQRAPMIAGAVGMPMVFVGIFPPNIFPSAFQPFIHLLPVSFITDGINVIGRGSPFVGLQADLLGLVAWAVVLLVGAARSFQWD